MALYHLHAKIIGRGGGQSAAHASSYRSGSAQRVARTPRQGHSAAAAASYRAGERIREAASGKWHDYTKKHGVIGADILLPDGAPAWMADRKRLMRSIDERERRADSQLVREVEVSLQRELTLEQNQLVVRAFVYEQFVSKGMVADIAWHDKGDGNPHAHILLTLRDIKEEVRHVEDLTDRKRQVVAGSPDVAYWGNKNREWNDYHRYKLNKEGKPNRDLIYRWRRVWEEHVNTAFDRYRVNARIDHRSYEARSINKVPTQHRGKQASALARKARPSPRMERVAGTHHQNASRANFAKGAKAWRVKSASRKWRTGRSVARAGIVPFEKKLAPPVIGAIHQLTGEMYGQDATRAEASRWRSELRRESGRAFPDR